MKTPLQKTKILLCLILLVSITFSCKEKPAEKVWEPIANPVKTTKGMECGEQQKIYTNGSQKTEMLIFKLQDKCEFPAYVWAGSSDSTLTAGTETTIPARKTIQSSCDLKPGESFYVLCSNVSTVANEGCELTYWIAATK